MKLTLQSKKKKSSTKKKAETKKEEKKKVSKKDLYYLDTNELPKNFSRQYITVDRLCYKHIIYCDVLSIKLGDEEVELVSNEEIKKKIDGENLELNSWARLLLLMLSTIHANHPDNFVEYLMDKDITNQEFCVDNKYGKYTFDSVNYKAFKIFNTNFYLEALFKFDVIYRAIIKMFDVLGMDKSQTTVQLINNKFNSNDKIIYELEKKCQVHANIKEAQSRMNKNSSISGVKILGIGADITYDSMIPIVFLNILKSKYKDSEEDIFNKMCKIGKTKLLSEQADTNESYHKIKSNKGKEYYLYSDGNLESIVRFIITSMNNLKIDLNDFTVYIYQLREFEKGDF